MNPFLRGVVAGLFFCAGVATDAYMNRNTELQARRAGYAAAVDSVRACERYPFADARNAFGDRFDVTVYDAADSVTAVVHFGRLPK